jgi:hypothetical protein
MTARSATACRHAGSCVWEPVDGVLDVLEELERDKVHSGWRGVLFAVSSDRSYEAEVGGVVCIVARVWGPHPGKDLGHRAKVLLHGPLANGPTVGGKLAHADAVRKHLEERDGVMDPVQGQVETQFAAEGAPLGLVGTAGCCLT